MESTENFRVLEKIALELCCTEAKVIPADQIAIENRVRLRCMIGCPTYGKNLKCPPYTPSVEEFRNMVNEYDFAMVVKLRYPEISPELTEKYKPKGEDAKLWNLYQDTDKIASTIWSDFAGIYRSMLTLLLELERAAFNQGYTLATAFFGGKCMLCEKCNVKNGFCLNPLMARFAVEAMGINMSKTAKNAGMELKFHSKNDPTPITPMAILLID